MHPTKSTKPKQGEKEPKRRQEPPPAKRMPAMALRPLLRARLPPSEESHGGAYEPDKGEQVSEGGKGGSVMIVGIRPSVVMGRMSE